MYRDLELAEVEDSDDGLLDNAMVVVAVLVTFLPSSVVSSRG
jgi:hypothetical protein